jgi:hypothetical protein
MKLLNLLCYMGLGGFLGYCKISPLEDYRFWVIMGLALAIDITSQLEK